MSATMSVQGTATSSISGCTHCGCDLNGRRHEFNREGDLLCLPCYRRRVRAKQSQRRRARFWSRCLQVSKYVLIALVLPPLVYLLLDVLSMRQG